VQGSPKTVSAASGGSGPAASGAAASTSAVTAPSLSLPSPLDAHPNEARIEINEASA
jgi:hypothetical protein